MNTVSKAFIDSNVVLHLLSGDAEKADRAEALLQSGGMISVPIVFRGPNGFASRVAAQHSQCYASWYGHVPGLKVVAP